MKYQYTVIESTSLEDLCEKVELALANGWKPQGGVCVIRCEIFTGTDEQEIIYEYYQALIAEVMVRLNYQIEEEDED